MKPPLKVAGIYLVVSVIWIYASDRLIKAAHPDETGEHVMIQTLKGSAFVLLTAILLYYLVRRFYSQLNKTVQDLEAANRQLKEQARQLRRSNEELEQFTFIASHDLQEPLRMVSSFLTRLESKYGDRLDEKGKQYLHFAVDGAGRMRRLLLDLLDYSRAGQQNLKPERLALRTVIDEVCSQYQQLIDERKARLEIGPMPELLHFRSLLHTLFSNLIGNAIKFHQPGQPPEIRITCTPLGNGWQISIEDTGIGFDPAYKDKVFQLFQRLAQAGEYQGTGMGLAIVKKIIDQLGERIWVDSEPGSGTRFYFTLTPLPASD